MNVYVDGPWADKQDKLLRYVEDEHSAYVYGPLNVDGMEIIHTDAEQTTFVVSNNSGITTAIYSFGGNNPAGGYDAGEIYIGASWYWPDASSLPTPGIYSHEGRDIHIIANDITLSAVSADTGVETYFDIGAYDGRFKLNNLEINCSRDPRDSVFVSGPDGGIVFDIDLYAVKSVYINGALCVDNSVFINGQLYAGTAFMVGPSIAEVQGAFQVNGSKFYCDYELTNVGTDVFQIRSTVFTTGPILTNELCALDKGIDIRVKRSNVSYPSDGLGIKEFDDNSVDGGIRLYPCLSSYHIGPHICGWHGDEGQDDNMHIVSGRGGGIALTVQDSNGSPRTAHLTYENITKLIALLESAD